MRRLLPPLALMAGLCAPAIAEPLPTLPPYTAAYEPTTVDERGQWMMADEYERELRDSPRRIRDGGIEAYVRSVLCRAVGAERCQGVRVYVMEVPATNASMMANGAMQVWSGLFLRVHDEGQLAAVLGHEFAHFELRHGVRGFKAKRGTTDAMAWLQVLGGITNTSVRDVQTTLVGSLYRYDRDQETQADLLGLRYLAASGYPAGSAAAVWQSMMAEEDARAVGHGQRPGQKYASGFLDDHPTNLHRATALAEEAARLPAGGDARADAYRKAIAPLLPRLLSAQVKINDFGGSDYILSSLATADGGWSAELLYARAELFRLRGQPRDLQVASGLYRDARAAGYAGPELDRNLGLALLRNGQTDEGRTALSAYLAASPGASDARAIAALIAN
ncbi:M48 family metallopeptidase [Sphingomonas sp. PR090111-T3T-6A]|uniref:M48 family metallopeptidase n=1 Tax=Sphingomonas sp. PR090111-T3T-6A TaxID=685778 RepID=UPI0004759B94|nr:M48 family metallopeptidase [Sphingomonas sp. PR090111-T3T-6A]